MSLLDRNVRWNNTVPVKHGSLHDSRLGTESQFSDHVVGRHYATFGQSAFKGWDLAKSQFCNRNKVCMISVVLELNELRS